MKKLMLINVDRSECVKCNACIEICPMHIIEKGDNGYPVAGFEGFKTCINCGYCVDVCKYGALSHKVRKRSVNEKAAFRAAIKRLNKLKSYRETQERK